MKKQALLYSIMIIISFSCVEPDVPENLPEYMSPEDKITGVANGGIVVAESGTVATPIASKNYLQINNTFSKLTGVPTSEETVFSEYEAIENQLPTTSNPTALSGFNQIAQSRLAFAYCDAYMNENLADYTVLSDAAGVKKLLDTFSDVDIAGNPAHQALYQNMLDIMSDSDQLINDNNAVRKKGKLYRLTCSALLSSAYVSMI